MISYYLAKDLTDVTPRPDWTLKGRQMTEAEKKAEWEWIKAQWSNEKEVGR